MDSNYRFSKEIDELLDRLDVVLDEKNVSRRPDASMRIALALCELLLDRCDSDQVTAISVSRSSLASGDQKTRELWFQRILGRNMPVLPLDRLIVCALHPNSPLDGFHGEFLTLLADQLGIETSKIEEIFANEVPEIRTSGQ